MNKNRAENIKEIYTDEYYYKKFNHYKKQIKFVVVFTLISSMLYWISDILIFKKMGLNPFDYHCLLCLIPRILIPSICIPIYIYIFDKYDNFKKITNWSYFFVHLVFWCIVSAVLYLPDKQFTREGWVIMQIVIAALGICMPIKTSVFNFSLYTIEMVIAHFVIKYFSYDWSYVLGSAYIGEVPIVLIISLGIPLSLGLLCMLTIIEELFLRNLHMQEEIKGMAFIDQLTKVYNRYIFKDGLVYNGCSVMISDIDDFKKINDTYGHKTGDIVLKWLAGEYISSVRKYDIVVRFGGEEFVIIFNKCDKIKAASIAETLRKDVEDESQRIFDFKVTISIGVTDCDNKDIETAIGIADKSLYKAKQSGKNKVLYS